MNLELVKIKSISDAQNETNLQYYNHKLHQSSSQIQTPCFRFSKYKDNSQRQGNSPLIWAKETRNQSEGGQQLNS